MKIDFKHVKVKTDGLLYTIYPNGYYMRKTGMWGYEERYYDYEAFHVSLIFI